MHTTTHATPTAFRLGGTDREALLRELQPVVVKTARLIVGSGTPLAEDAAQEALLAVWRAAPDLADTRAARAWAATIATRTAIRYAQRERRRAWLGRERVAVEETFRTEASSDMLELKDAFDALPPKQRAVAVLRLYVGLDERETAAAVGCSVGTVKSQLHDARRSLRRSLGNRDDAEAMASAHEDDTEKRHRR
jgi:RNA polymerase sigma factor (sigma-70 family)